MNANIDFWGRFLDRNPFSSRATRPGAIAYRFANGCDLSQLVATLRTHGWWGQIVGPHGSGKSTLLHALLSPLGDAGRTVRHYTLHSGEKRIPIAGGELKSWDAETQVIIDGFEQLGGWNRSMLKRVCRQQGAGLLVTSHQCVGFPTLFSPAVTPQMAQQLVTDLLSPRLPADRPRRRCAQFRAARGKSARGVLRALRRLRDAPLRVTDGGVHFFV